MPNAEITAAILAGGQGRRVGGNDKGWVAVAGRPLIEHVTNALRRQAGAILICANRNMLDYGRFGTVVADASPGFHGPLAGIAAVLASCRTRWLLTVPVDAPSPPQDLAQRLSVAAQMRGAAAAVAHDGVRRQPLFALYQAHLVQSAAAALADDEPVYRWQDRIEAIEVDFPDRAQSFANLNTLAEIHEWERHHAE